MGKQQVEQHADQSQPGYQSRVIQYLSVGEAAAAMGISDATLRRLIWTNQIDAAQIGRSYGIHQSAVDAYKSAAAGRLADSGNAPEIAEMYAAAGSETSGVVAGETKAEVAAETPEAAYLAGESQRADAAAAVAPESVDAGDSFDL